MDVPEELKAKIDLFRPSGRIMPSADELFDARGWVQVMIGQNILPESWHPVADQMPETRLRELLEGLERVYVQDAARMPEHAAYVAKFAPMKQPEPVA